jgi:hypothetical protein
MAALENSFRYYQVMVSAQSLPGRLRIDPLAVVFTGGPGGYAEVGRTEKRPNSWNPQFATSIALPADSDVERAVDVRIDFYNKNVSEDRFLGTASCSLHHLIDAAGAPVVLPLKTPEAGEGDPKARVQVVATEGYRSPTSDAGKTARFAFEMEQTNFYGVAMTAYYEISRSTGAAWVPVLTSGHSKVDPQGWVQFRSTSITLMELVQDQPSMPLMLSVYRHKTLGPRRLLGHVQFTLEQLVRTEPGDLLPFVGNTRENLLAADCSVEHAKQNNGIYQIALKLVNVRWKADEIPNPNAARA